MTKTINIIIIYLFFLISEDHIQLNYIYLKNHSYYNYHEEITGNKILH